MAFHRVIQVRETCSACGALGRRDVQIFVGVSDGAVMRLGHVIPWTGSPYVERGGRPPSTTGIAYGIGDCRRCGTCFEYDVVVEDSVVTEVKLARPWEAIHMVPPPWRDPLRDDLVEQRLEDYEHLWDPASGFGLLEPGGGACVVVNVAGRTGTLLECDATLLQQIEERMRAAGVPVFTQEAWDALPPPEREP